MGFMILPTIASSPRTRCPRCRSRCARARSASARSKLQVSLRVVFPAALSGIVAAIVLGVSRAVGETMIVLVAAGPGGQQLSRDPREPHADDDRVHRARPAKGDIADRQHRVQDDLRGRHDAVRDHAGHEPDLDPLRAQVQAGVRVSAHGAGDPAGVDDRGGPRTSRSGCAAGLPRAVDPAARRAARSTWSSTALGRLSLDFLTSFPSIDADKAGHPGRASGARSG